MPSRLMRFSAGHEAIAENQLAGSGGADTDFLFLLPECETGVSLSTIKALAPRALWSYQLRQ